MSSEFIIPSCKTMNEDIQHLKEWISKEPHLPNIDDEPWLKTFLYHNNHSLERTKRKLEHYYSYRTKYPELLKNRDPSSPEMLQCREAFTIVLAEKQTEDDTSVMHGKWGADADLFDMTAFARRYFMFVDLMILSEKRRFVNFITIVDLQHFSYLHAVKFISGLPKATEIVKKAYMGRGRSKAVHLLNFPPVAQKPFEILQMLLPDKYRGKFHIHTASKNTLFETVDEKLVSCDFGGSGPSLAKLEERTQQELEKYREWFKEQDGVCSDESLRRKNSNQAEEMKGSFRKLEVD